MSVELKIKAKSLAAEARIIRAMEDRLLRSAQKGEGKVTKLERRALAKRKQGKILTPREFTAVIRYEKRRALNRKPFNCDLLRADRERIRDHRIRDLRPAARATHLARGFLRKAIYADLEDPTATDTGSIPYAEIARMVVKYGPSEWQLTGEKACIEKLREWTGLE